jgi:hypothetical protein
MNACPQTVLSGDGSRQFTTSFACDVREAAAFCLAETA